MRKSILLTIYILVGISLCAQKSFKKNTAYVEAAGSGLVLSANYERQTGAKPGLGFYIGVGLAGEKPAIPIGAKYLFDLGNQKSFIETGAGIVLAEAGFLDDDKNSNTERNAYTAGFIPSVGYRHHTPYGLMWRVNYTPVFSSDRTLLGFGGVSVGWRW